MNLIGKVALIEYGDRFWLTTIKRVIKHPRNNNCESSIVVDLAGQPDQLIYSEPEHSRHLKYILDFHNYKESNKDKISSMLVSKDEDSRKLALEILKQYNCLVI